MSKPKPGLGKGIVRTLAHSSHPPSSSTASLSLSSSLNNASAYSTSSSTSASGSVFYGPAVSSRRDFGSIGLPSSSANSGRTSPTSAGRKGKERAGYSYSTLFPTTSTSGHNGSTAAWEGETEIVKSFRTSRYTHGRPASPPSAAHSGSSSSTSSRRRLSTISTPPYPHANGIFSDASSLFASIPSIHPLPLLSSLLDKTLWTSPPETGLDLIVSPPSPPPTIRVRPNEIHPALSPLPVYDTLSSNNSFATLGIPSRALHRSLYATVADVSSSSDAATAAAASQLVFHLGATGLAKERPSYTPPKRVSSPAPPPRPRSFPLPDVSPPEAVDLRSVGVGEDAYFARMDGMCIADGVGGWAKSGRGGADAGRWSRLLTHFCEVELGLWDRGIGPYSAGRGETGLEGSEEWSKKIWENAKDSNGGRDADWSSNHQGRKAVDPVEIMQRGFEKCLSCFVNEGIHGSSTCLLACLYDSTLSIANLGDCCLLVIRQNEIIFRTDEMQHAFNFPLQLGTHSRDEPMKDAKRYDVGVGKGDVVILGSDGLMDNLFDEDILETLAQFTTPSDGDSSQSGSSGNDLIPFSPQKVSEALCNRAREVSEQTSATTPFMVRAIEEGIDFVGGKKDDISVVVGVVGDRHSGRSEGLALHTR